MTANSTSYEHLDLSQFATPTLNRECNCGATFHGHDEHHSHCYVNLPVPEPFTSGVFVVLESSADAARSEFLQNHEKTRFPHEFPPLGPLDGVIKIHTNVDPSADPNVIELPSAIDPSSPLGIVEKELTDLGSLPDTPYVLRPTLTFSTFSYLADLLHGILDYLPSVFGPEDHRDPAYHEHPVRRILHRLGSYYNYGFIPPPDRDPAPPLVPLTQSEALYLLDLVRATYTLSREFRRLDVPYDQRASIR